jgi:hypothetical protein
MPTMSFRSRSNFEKPFSAIDHSTKTLEMLHNLKFWYGWKLQIIRLETSEITPIWTLGIFLWRLDSYVRERAFFQACDKISNIVDSGNANGELRQSFVVVTLIVFTYVTRNVHRRERISQSSTETRCFSSGGATVSSPRTDALALRSHLENKHTWLEHF